MKIAKIKRHIDVTGEEIAIIFGLMALRYSDIQ